MKALHVIDSWHDLILHVVSIATVINNLAIQMQAAGWTGCDTLELYMNLT